MPANLDDMARVNVPTYYKAEGNVTLDSATLPSGSTTGVLLTSTNILQFLGDYYCASGVTALFTLPEFARPRSTLMVPVAYYGGTYHAYGMTVVRIGTNGKVTMNVAPTETFRLYFSEICISLARGYYG